MKKTFQNIKIVIDFFVAGDIQPHYRNEKACKTRCQVKIPSAKKSASKYYRDQTPEGQFTTSDKP